MSPSDLYREKQRERRERIATNILAGFAAGDLPSDPGLRAGVIEKVLVYTDALIERLAQ